MSNDAIIKTDNVLVRVMVLGHGSSTDWRRSIVTHSLPATIDYVATDSKLPFSVTLIASSAHAKSVNGRW